MFFLFAYITYNVQFMETVPSTLTCLLYYRTFSPSSWHGYRFFSSSLDCMKERMSDPISTVRSTISIVLNVLRFCCMVVFSCLSYPEFPAWSITILQVEMLAYPGVKTCHLRQV